MDVRNATAFNQDVGGWDTSKVVSMEGMFSACAAFNQYAGGWDTSRVANVGTMFFEASAFNQDLDSWDTSSVTIMDGMFSEAAAFNQDLGWCLSSSVVSTNAFFGAACSSILCGSSLNCTAPESGATSAQQRSEPWWAGVSDVPRLLFTTAVIGCLACASAFGCRLAPPTARLDEYDLLVDDVENESEYNTSQVDADADGYKVGSLELATRASDDGIDAVLDGLLTPALRLRRVGDETIVALWNKGLRDCSRFNVEPGSTLRGVPTFAESDVATLETAFSDPTLRCFLLRLRASSALRAPVVVEMQV